MKKKLHYSILLFVFLFSVFTLKAQEAPSGESPQYFSASEDLILDNISVFGTDITWYDVEISGSIIPNTTLLENDTSYWAAQGTNPEAERLEIHVYITEPIPAPYTYDIPIIQCDDEGVLLADLPVFNTDGFDNIYWFSTNNQMSGSEIDPNTEIEEGVIYYAFQGVGCCAEALEVTVQLEESIPPVTGDTDQFFCTSSNPTVADLVAYNTEGYDYILWYPICCPTSESEALDPDTLLEDGVVYTAHQGISAYCNYGRLPVTVHLLESIPAPISCEMPINIGNCSETTLTELPVFNTDDFETIFWFDSLTQETGTLLANNTTIEEGTTYYAFQAIGSCAVGLEVNTTCLEAIPAPTTDMTLPFTVGAYCNTTLEQLPIYNTDSFTDIFWFSSPSLEEDTGLSPDTVAQEGITYYATQGVGSSVETLAVSVIYQAEPAPDLVGDNPFNFCSSESITLADLPVYNTGDFDGIYWFDSATQDVILSPDTLVESGVSYFAFQGLCCCSTPLEVIGNVVWDVPAPYGESVMTFCCEETLTFADTPVFNTAAYENLYWFTSDDNSGTPLPNESEVEINNTYYAFQSLDACAESLAVYFTCIPPIPAPYGENIQNIEDCSITRLEDLEVYNTEGLDGIYWFNTAYQETGIQLDYMTLVEDGVTYYAFQGIGDCFESLAVTVHCIIGLEEEQETFFSISPNPVEESLTISTTTELYRSKINIFNSIGMQVYTHKERLINGSTNIDVSFLESGIYFIKIEDENKTQSKRFVKE